MSASTPKGELMPQTKEQYLKIMERDDNIILKQRDEINRLKQDVNDLRQKLRAKTLNQDDKI